MAYPDFSGVYEQKLKALQGQRDATLSQNAYSRFLSTQRGNRQALDLDRSRTKGVGSLSSNFARRGLLNSGLVKRARVEYANDWATDRNDLMETLKQELAKYDMADASANAQYNLGVADIEASKLRDILQTASQLSAFQQFIGS